MTAHVLVAPGAGSLPKNVAEHVPVPLMAFVTHVGSTPKRTVELAGTVNVPLTVAVAHSLTRNVQLAGGVGAGAGATT